MYPGTIFQFEEGDEDADHCKRGMISEIPAPTAAEEEEEETEQPPEKRNAKSMEDFFVSLSRDVMDMYGPSELIKIAGKDKHERGVNIHKVSCCGHFKNTEILRY